jgi:glutamate-1-semialdehyde 2,1-aminomutase
MPEDSVGRQLDRALLDRYPEWRAFTEAGPTLLPSGVAHDNRFTGGPVLPVAEGVGPLKRDVAGNEFVDFWMGHGALLLGHGNARVVAAAREWVGKLTHAGGCHELEHEWARLVIELIPSAERVRFTMSGTESVMLALRLARAFTGRDGVLKLDGHFHGWSDFTLAGVVPPFDVPSGGGWSRGAVSATRSVPADADTVREALAAREFACLIIEPTGASGGSVPLPPSFLADCREIARATGTVLVFDEVITGFRVSPGGAQAKFGVSPDLTCLGKIVAGGFPGAAVAGRAEVMEGLAFSGEKERDRKRRVAHWGTFNANPVSAAAGVACLEQVRSGEPGRRADEFALSFREELNALFDELNVGWRSYGHDSVLHVNTAPNAAELLGVKSHEARMAAAAELKRKRPEDLWLKKALWLEGVDWPGGKQAWSSCTHGPSELRRTVEAFHAAVERLRGLGAKV